MPAVSLSLAHLVVSYGELLQDTALSETLASLEMSVKSDHLEIILKYSVGLETKFSLDLHNFGPTLLSSVPISACSSETLRSEPLPESKESRRGEGV